MKNSEKYHSKKQFNKLLEKIFHQEKDAFEEFCNVYGKFIFIKARNIVKNNFLADEIVNDVIIKVWKASANTRDIENPPGWIYTITVNCAKDKLKTEKQFCEIYDMPCNDENLEKVVSDDAFYNEIAHLNEQEKDVIIFKIVQKLSFKAIAELKLMPASSVSSIYYRALQKIKLKKI